MRQTVEAGMNRTGMKTAPERAEAMTEGIEEFPVHGVPREDELAQMREEYAKSGEALGSMPPPAGVGGKVKAAAKAATGGHPTLFLDKMGERLAFERSGTRFYEGLVSKHHAYGSFSGGPSIADIEKILEEEQRHFTMLVECMEKLGGDPTAMTPSADLHANTSKGIGDVIADPRTSFLQSLEAILIAELADTASWEVLVELARKAGEKDMVALFEEALAREEEHIRKVKAWIAAGQARTTIGEARAS